MAAWGTTVKSNFDRGGQNTEPGNPSIAELEAATGSSHLRIAGITNT